MGKEYLKGVREQSRSNSRIVKTDGGTTLYTAGVGGATDVNFGDRFTEIRKEFFGDDYPSSALITVAGLARLEMLAESQGITVIRE